MMGCSFGNSEFAVSVSDTNDDANEDVHFEYFPNPANNNLNITINGDVLNGSISIADLAGREVYRTTANGKTMQVDVNSLPNGMYILSLNLGKMAVQSEILIITK